MTAQMLDKAQLRWQCRRGMLELDLMLSSFLDQQFDDLAQDEREDFAELLKSSDNDLFGWLTGSSRPEAKKMEMLITKIRACKR